MLCAASGSEENDEDDGEALCVSKESEEKKSSGKLPSFRDVINLQTTAGNWTDSSRSLLASCLAEGESFEDADVMEALSQV